MNQRLFQLEMKRIFKSDRLYLMWAVVLVFLTFQGYRIYMFQQHAQVTPSAIQIMVEFETDGTLRHIYIMILPVIVAFIAAQSYVEDRRAGYFPMMEMRIDRKTYLHTTAVVSFLAGGIVAVVPLLIQALVAFTAYPLYHYPYHEYLSIHSVYIDWWLQGPLWLWFFSTVQFFLFGAVLSFFAFGISLFFHGLHAETFFAFLLLYIFQTFRPYVWSGPLEPAFYLQIIFDDLSTYGDVRPVKWITFFLFFIVAYGCIRRKVRHGTDL